MNSVAAIVMASSATSDAAFARVSPNACKSLIPVNGRPAVSYVVDNLRACEHVSKVIMISDMRTFEAVAGADLHIEATSNEATDILAGVRVAGDVSRCLIMAGDMPLASADAVSDFLTYAPDCDLAYPIVAKEDVKKFYPQREAYYLGTKEGKFTGSSSLLFRPEVALSREAFITDILNARKNPKALLGLLGPGVAFKLMLTTPAINDFENLLSNALDMDCRVFISHYPELVMSIDSLDDIKIMEQELT